MQVAQEKLPAVDAVTIGQKIPPEFYATRELISQREENGRTICFYRPKSGVKTR